jgi:hypothetical protein
MTPFQQQLTAIGSALLHIEKLPLDTPWSLVCTNEDDVSSPTALTIFVPHTMWEGLAARFKLRSKPTENTRRALAYQQGSLYITFTEE